MIKKKRDFFLDEIVDIEEVGIIDTYDFKIPKTHCFFANGVLVHNSGFLEEHADVVYLLSWPFKALKQVEGKVLTLEQLHKFIVYVAKNKDGQTGYRKLKFTPEYYLFEDWNEQDKIKPASDRTDSAWQE